MRGRPTDHEGVRYGRLLALECVGKRGDRTDYHWRCLCNPEWGGCGRYTIAGGYHLSIGKKRSCGCLSAEMARERGRERRLGVPTRSPPRPRIKVVSPGGVTYDSMDDAALVHGVTRMTIKNWLRARNAAGVSPHGWRRAA